MLRASVYERIDGVLITHEHYDHVGGLDDLRPFCRFSEIPVYSDAYTAAHLRARMPYCLFAGSGSGQAFLRARNGNTAGYRDARAAAYPGIPYRQAAGVCNGHAYDAGCFV